MKHCKWFLAAAFALAVTGITFAQIGVAASLLVTFLLALLQICWMWTGLTAALMEVS
jgi:hypothetical protein